MNTTSRKQLVHRIAWGDRLIQARVRLNLSQEALAEAIGTTARSINRWEHNRAFPQPYYLDRLCRVLQCTPEELFGASKEPSQQITTLPLFWNIPYPRNPYFTGRDDLLKQLAQHFSSQEMGTSMSIPRAALTQPQAIKGLGGIGKTQIAVEYAYRAREQAIYDHILWINAASKEALLNSFTALAELLPAFSARGETDQRKLVAAIKHWLEQCPQRWLVTFDNADDLSLIQEYLPHQGNGHLLLTTRANAVGAFATSIDVENMGLAEGTAFLLHRAQRQHTNDEESNEATNLVIALDGFPLALDQAGAYIEETRCSFQAYLQLYQEHRQVLLARRGTQSTYYLDSVATTWSLSFQHVEQSNPAAAELLHLCAFLAPDAIPEELLQEGAVHWPSLLQQNTTDLLAFNQMLQELLRFSLIKRNVEQHTLSIHRLVQAIQQDQMSIEEQSQWAERVVRAVNEVFPREVEETITSWPLCVRYLEQAQVCDTLIEQYHLTFPEAANLLDRAGCYLDQHASYTLAEMLYRRALTIRERQTRPQHLTVAVSLGRLGNLYRLQGKYTEAEPLYEQALDIHEHQPEPQYPLMAFILHGLATLYKDQGKYEQAEPLFRQALQIREQHLGPDHPLVAHTLTGLANLFKDQGAYEQAKASYQRALQIREQHLGPDHPDVPYTLNALALLYYEEGKNEQAERLYQRALQIRQQHLGPDHPLVARPLHNLGLLAYEQGKYEQAEQLYQQALNIMERHLGSDHPDLASSLTSLARLYCDLGRYEQAEPLYQRALQIREQHLGSEHPLLTYPFTGLAALYQQQAKYQQAEELYQRSIQIIEQRLGLEHPMLPYSIYGLANLYYELGKYKEAEPLYQRSLRIKQQNLISGHPDHAFDFTGLAELARARGAYEQAAPLYQQALQLREQSLGHEHPLVATCLAGLAVLYLELGKDELVAKLCQRALSIQEQVLGPQHPEVAALLLLQAQLAEKQGQKEQAILLVQRASTIFEQSLGPNHPKTRKARSTYQRLLT